MLCIYDTTSQFLAKGKKSSWAAWKAYPSVTRAFQHVAENPIRLQWNLLLERFTCVLYDKTTRVNNIINDLRRDLFSKRAKLMDNIPPTQVSSIKAILAIMKILPPPIGCTHTAYQPGTLSSKYLEHMPYRAQQNITEPEKFGWILLEQAWKPVWTLLPEVARACQELLKCGCKSCSEKCKCRDAGLSCTGLCYCGAVNLFFSLYVATLIIIYCFLVG